MANRRITWLSPADPPASFPPVELALDEPDGLLAAGGDLSAARLLNAYPRGIFPWYDSGQPILWWSPDPRCILYPDRFRLSRRMQRECRRSPLVLTVNRSFSAVMAACAAPRKPLQGTWITADMVSAYSELHELGWAHSFELWRDGRLVGGIYGLAIGQVFFGESMFHRENNASKFALYALLRVLRPRGFSMLDCQTVSRHLLTLGAVTVPRRDFVAALARLCTPAVPFVDWPREPLMLRDLSASGDPVALQ
jgi:leucyl/phenylalanyl-tRNA---protein transferase